MNWFEKLVSATFGLGFVLGYGGLILAVLRWDDPARGFFGRVCLVGVALMLLSLFELIAWAVVSLS